MDNDLMLKENAALKTSVDYMTKWFNGNVDYGRDKTRKIRRQEMPIISEQVNAFWKQCTETFQSEVWELLDMWSSIAGKSDANKESDTGEDRDTSEELTTLSSNMNGAVDAGAIWITPIQRLEEAYTNLIFAYNFTSDQERRLEELFDQFRKTAQKYVESLEKGRKLKGTTLGRIDFKYLSHMLDIERTEVQELLPYLLTAYTFNFVENRFFNRGGRLIPMIYPDNVESAELMVTSTDAAKMRPSIKTLSKVFSLEKCKQALLLLDKSELSESERPEPFFAIFDKIYVKPPYIRYKPVLDRAFDIWCGVIYEYAPLAEINGFPSNIDWESCKALYSFYTDETATC